MTSVRVAADAIAERRRALSAFADAEAEHIPRVCRDLARAFSRGGVLHALGTGPAATDAAHVAVEFMHPVIVGKRALPALAHTDATRVAALSRAGDVLLAIDHDGPGLQPALDDAARRGLMTIALVPAGVTARADHVLVATSDDPWIVQELQETAYHVIWELVHVFFEHPGLLEETCVTCGDVAVEVRVVAVDGETAVVERGGTRETLAITLVGDVAPGDRLLAHAGVALQRLEGEEDGTAASAFLYPFLDRAERDLGSVLDDVRRSTLAKCATVSDLRAQIDVDAVQRAGAAAARRLASGGRLLAFGNGGSATDAQDLAVDALARGLPAISLVDDIGTVTAVANDVGVANVFARQLIALAGPQDVAVGFSTSGSSANVVDGLAEAHRRGLETIAIVGSSGGRCAEQPWLDHLLVVESDDIPRIQEVHATMYHLLLDGAVS